MKEGYDKIVHVLEFDCESPLRFYEHCAACPRFEDCPDLVLGVEILRGKKRLTYSREPSVDGVHVSEFKCFAPVNYFFKSRETCAHKGRCREEGLLLALLRGKRGLDYSRGEAIRITERRPRRRAARVKEVAVGEG